MQQKLAEIEMAGAAGGGMVTVTLNGKGEMREIKIDPVAGRSQRDRDPGGSPVVAACNDAKAKIEAHMQEEMGKLTGGLPLPPGFKLPF